MVVQVDGDRRKNSNKSQIGLALLTQKISDNKTKGFNLITLNIESVTTVSLLVNIVFSILN